MDLTAEELRQRIDIAGLDQDEPISVGVELRVADQAVVNGNLIETITDCLGLWLHLIDINLGAPTVSFTIHSRGLDRGDAQIAHAVADLHRRGFHVVVADDENVRVMTVSVNPISNMQPFWSHDIVMISAN